MGSENAAEPEDPGRLQGQGNRTEQKTGRIQTRHRRAGVPFGSHRKGTPQRLGGSWLRNEHSADAVSQTGREGQLRRRLLPRQSLQQKGSYRDQETSPVPIPFMTTSNTHARPRYTGVQKTRQAPMAPRFHDTFFSYGPAQIRPIHRAQAVHLFSQDNYTMFRPSVKKALFGLVAHQI